MTLHDLERALVTAASAYLKAILAEALAGGIAPRVKQLSPAKPAAKPAPLAPSKPSGLGYTPPVKRCIKCKKSYQPRGNRQMRCDACGAKPPRGSQKKSGPGRPRTWKKQAKAEALRPDRPVVLRPKPPPPDDPKKAVFDAWMRKENQKRAAAGKALADRALAGVGADVEDVPLAAAVKRHP